MESVYRTRKLGPKVTLKVLRFHFGVTQVNAILPNPTVSGGIWKFRNVLRIHRFSETSGFSKRNAKETEAQKCVFVAGTDARLVLRKTIKTI